MNSKFRKNVKHFHTYLSYLIVGIIMTFVLDKSVVQELFWTPYLETLFRYIYIYIMKMYGCSASSKFFVRLLNLVKCRTDVVVCLKD